MAAVTANNLCSSPRKRHLRIEEAVALSKLKKTINATLSTMKYLKILTQTIALVLLAQRLYYYKTNFRWYYFDCYIPYFALYNIDDLRQKIQEVTQEVIVELNIEINYNLASIFPKVSYEKRKDEFIRGCVRQLANIDRMFCIAILKTQNEEDFIASMEPILTTAEFIDSKESYIGVLYSLKQFIEDNCVPEYDEILDKVTHVEFERQFVIANLYNAVIAFTDLCKSMIICILALYIVIRLTPRSLKVYMALTTTTQAAAAICIKFTLNNVDEDLSWKMNEKKKHYASKNSLQPVDDLILIHAIVLVFICLNCDENGIKSICHGIVNSIEYINQGIITLILEPIDRLKRQFSRIISTICGYPLQLKEKWRQRKGKDKCIPSGLKENGNLQETDKQEKDIVKKPKENDKSELKVFECPVCFEIMEAPKQIYGCSNDHYICSECLKSSRIKCCPLCRVNFKVNKPQRRYQSEHLLAILLEKCE